MKRSFYWFIDLYCSSDLKEPVTALAHSLNSSGIQIENNRMLIYFQDHDSAMQFSLMFSRLKKELVELGLKGQVDWNLKKGEFQQWNRSWQKSIRPVEVGRSLIILAPWHSYTGKRVRVIIEPGMAFGTGQHETTRLCLEEIERLSSRKPMSLLDVGTGSGILAIAAMKLGIKKVVAIDIDHDAIKAAIKNKEINKTGDILLVQASPSALKGHFDIVVANLTLKGITGVFKELKRLLDKGGNIILSGILIEQEHELLRFLASQGISEYRIIKKGKWLGLTL